MIIIIMSVPDNFLELHEQDKTSLDSAVFGEGVQG